jgi:hypothetical protein
MTWRLKNVRSLTVYLILMKNTLWPEITNAIPDTAYAKEYLASMEEHFKNNLPSEAEI